MNREQYVKRILEIANEKPAYKLGGDGSNGTCDCVGLCIGALRRGGVRYSNLHSTNWAARNEAVELWRIDSVSSLRVGDTVLKAYEPGDADWNLPERYKNDPDQRDYYHAGVVVSVNPLKIVHMTSPTAKTDTTLGRWRFAFLWRQISSEAAKDDIGQEDTAMSTLYKAKVITQEDPLTLRNAPDGSKIGKLPRGATVDVLVEVDGWAYVRYEGRSGYASMKYLEACEPEEEESLHLCLVFTDSAGNTWIPVGDFSATLKVVND